MNQIEIFQASQAVLKRRLSFLVAFNLSKSVEANMIRRELARRQ